MGRRWLRNLSLAMLVASFVPGPTLLNIASIGVNLFDLIFIGVVASFGVFLATGRLGIVQPRLLSGLGLIYPLAVVAFSILGLIIYSYPASYALGDLRWVQTLAAAFVCLAVWSSEEDLTDAMRYVVYSTIFINIVFICIQWVAYTNSGHSDFLQWWYKDVPDYADRRYGFHSGRFSGGMGQPSGLGFFAALAIAYAILVIDNRVAKVVVLTTALFMIVASGSRTAMVAISIVILWYALTSGEARRLTFLMGIILASIIAYTAALNLNVGRVGDLGRYEAILDIAVGDIDYHDVSNRETAWRTSIERHSKEFVVIGTLSNPSNVYNDIIIDSGYIHAYIRLGVVGLLSMILMLCMPMAALIIHGRRRWIVVAAAMCMVLLVMSINQNTLTTIYAKMVISIIVVSLSLSKVVPKTGGVR